jgi:hypothetical protein
MVSIRTALLAAATSAICSSVFATPLRSANSTTVNNVYTREGEADDEPEAPWILVHQAGYDVNNLYWEAFTMEAEAKKTSNFRSAENNGRHLFLIHNQDPDTMVVKLTLKIPEHTEVRAIVPPLGWAIIGNAEKGEERRLWANPGCNSEGEDCLPDYGIVNLLEYTDGGTG